MRILIVSATRKEISHLLQRFKIKVANGKVSRVRLKVNTIDFLVTGVGMAQTAFYLGKVELSRYDLAINVGICGSFTNDLELQTLVRIKSDRFADLGAESGIGFRTLKELRLVKRDVFQERLTLGVKKKFRGIRVVKGITVNTVHGKKASIHEVRKKFHPDVESMEGAAFFMACHLDKIKCTQIRAVSNKVEVRNKNNWKILPAIKVLNNYLMDLLLKL